MQSRFGQLIIVAGIALGASAAACGSETEPQPVVAEEPTVPADNFPKGTNSHGHPDKNHPCDGGAASSADTDTDTNDGIR
jgi:hypothetical protein